MIRSFKAIALFLFLLIAVTNTAVSQDFLSVDSRFLKRKDSVLVFKPASYVLTKTYPVVYLLHGHSANYRSWARLANLQSIADTYEFLIVCPDGLKSSWYINSPTKDSSQYESFFIKELMVKIGEVYKVDKKQIFITGASMGGHGALWLFLNNPELFLSAGSTSGVVNLRHSGFKKTTIAGHLGSYTDDNKAFDDYSVVNNIQKLAGKGKVFIFDCGTEDYLYKANKSLRDKCDELKIPATYIAQPGAHTGGYWSGTIIQHMEFFNKQIKK